MMMSTPEPAARRDVVVVMARGESRRFGEPKALAVLPGDPRPLLLRVVDLHAGTGRSPILVVTTHRLGPDCGAALAGVPGVRVVTASGGGDTAQTLAFAWDVLAEEAPNWTHAWVHPVDVPEVALPTLAGLGEVSRQWPDRQVRPVWNGRPGHPVVVPASLLGALLEQARVSAAPWREVLAAAVDAGRVAAPVMVPVADPGVALDHDVRPG
jgi:CTP:molybdopterin cytidylyltransferase MocA